MRMSGKGTLVLAAAIYCGFLLFANTCVASGDVSTGGERYRKEHLGFSVADEEEYTSNMVEQSMQLHVPYYFKLVKPRSKAVRETMEYLFERSPVLAGRWVACDAAVLQEEEKNTFWLHLGPSPRRDCKKNPTRMKRMIVKHLDGKFEVVSEEDYPTLYQDQLLKRRDKDGKWLVDPETDVRGGDAYKKFLESRYAAQAQADSNADDNNDEL